MQNEEKKAKQIEAKRSKSKQSEGKVKRWVLLYLRREQKKYLTLLHRKKG
jgi:hypothetical protein